MPAAKNQSRQKLTFRCSSGFWSFKGSSDYPLPLFCVKEMGPRPQLVRSLLLALYSFYSTMICPFFCSIKRNLEWCSIKYRRALPLSVLISSLHNHHSAGASLPSLTLHRPGFVTSHLFPIFRALQFLLLLSPKDISKGQGQSSQLYSLLVALIRGFGRRG